MDNDVDMKQDCPCGSGRELAACCHAYFSAEIVSMAKTAEELMRSRYTAYVLGINEYISRTWHASTRPAKSDFFDPDVKWLGLKVVDCSETEEFHFVSFVARYKIAGKAYRLEEKSRFVFENGQWFYLDGVALKD